MEYLLNSIILLISLISSIAMLLVAFLFHLFSLMRNKISHHVADSQTRILKHEGVTEESCKSLHSERLHVALDIFAVSFTLFDIFSDRFSLFP